MPDNVESFDFLTLVGDLWKLVTTYSPRLNNSRIDSGTSADFIALDSTKIKANLSPSAVQTAKKSQHDQPIDLPHAKGARDSTGSRNGGVGAQRPVSSSSNHESEGSGIMHSQRIASIAIEGLSLDAVPNSNTAAILKRIALGLHQQPLSE